MKDADDVQEILDLIRYPEYEFAVSNAEGRLYLQARYKEPCVVTGADEYQYTRKWYISQEATKSEIVQTALKCVLTSAEHRVREHFTYKGELVFGPHFDVDALADLARARRLDLRPYWPSPEMTLPLTKGAAK